MAPDLLNNRAGLMPLCWSLTHIWDNQVYDIKIPALDVYLKLIIVQKRHFKKSLLIL